MPNKWVMQTEGHPIHSALLDLQSRIASIEGTNPSDADIIEGLDRLRQIVNKVLSSLEAGDPNMIPRQALDQINSNAQNAANQLSNYQTNKNKQHIDNANEQADGMLVQLRSLPVPESVRDIDNLRDAITSFRRSMGQHTHNVQDEFRNLSKEFNDLSKRIAEAVNEISAQKSRLDTAIVSYQQQFSQAEEIRREQFSTSEKGRDERFEKLIAAHRDEITNQIETMRAAWADLVKNTEDNFNVKEKAFGQDGRTLLDKLAEYKEQAEKTLHAIGIAGMASGYNKVANSERKAAWLWHGITGLFLVGLVVFAIIAFESTLRGEFSIGIFGARAFVALAFGIGVAWAARQAGMHQAAEQRSRRMELELASISPYLATLPEDSQNQVKQELAERLFGQKDQLIPGSTKETTGSVLDLLRMALDTIQSLSKK